MIKIRNKKPEANELQGIANHDANGNMTVMPGLKAKYDAWNRLTEVRDSSDNLIAQYEYNGLNQRIKKTVNSVVTKFFFNENWQELESTTAGQTTSCVWGLRYIDDLILREKGEERLYSLADPNWNVAAIVDANGAVVERYTYDAFGKRNVFDSSFTAKADTDYNWNRTFTGQVLDSETGLMLYRNRYFNTILGRWTSRDPIGYLGGWNNYRYTANIPNIYVDVLGFSEDCVDSSVSLAFGISDPLDKLSARLGFAATFSMSISGMVSGKVCYHCCNDGTKRLHKSFAGSVTYNGSITVIIGTQINTDVGYFKIEGYAGLQGEVSTSGVLDLSYNWDECDPNPGKICYTPSFNGVIRGGINTTISYKNWSMDIATAEVFANVSASKTICFKITANGFEFDPDSSNGATQVSTTVGVRACVYGICATASSIFKLI